MSFDFDVFTDVSCVSSKFDGVLLDAYGVFWGNNEFGALPGAKEAMEKLVSKGKVVGILSNSTQLSSKEISKLEKHGLIRGKHFHFLLTSGEIARNIILRDGFSFATPNKKFLLFLGGHPIFSSHKAIFEGTAYEEASNIDEADFIYVSVPHINGIDQTDPEVFVSGVEKVKEKKLPMVCVNPDLFACEGKSLRLVVRQGSIAKIYEEMGGKVIYMGKPHRLAYDFALDEFKKYGIKTPSKALMVGDTPETDIRGAKNCGMASALITETGITAGRIAKSGKQIVKKLPLSDFPDYFIKTL